MPEASQKRTQKWTHRVPRGLLCTAEAGLLVIAFCERFQPDAFAAATAIPPWCWLVAFMGIGSLGLAAANRWEWIIAGALLLLFLVFSVEQSRTLSRSAWDSVFNSTKGAQRRHLRVVTVNCNLGSRQAAGEVARFDPDIVLLQESPNERAVDELAHSMFGSSASTVWSPDCSILARGRLHPANGHDTTRDAKFVQATLTLVNGRMIEVVCFRLSPPVVRYDLWSPTCWTDHANVRRKHRQEAMAISNALSSVPNDRPIMIGGDCNAPGGDGALQVWSWRLQDAFDAAGRGWGATVLNVLPVLRFDQLWCTDHVQTVAVRSVKTQYSDHRLVVGDFGITQP